MQVPELKQDNTWDYRRKKIYFNLFFTSGITSDLFNLKALQ